ncbi:hypothetical protein [Krasilnikovia cinnamomea]|uniref:hypothetical protein n=1 Tax=Krasilnikovia cinnamomea TaxID=349313 RepID=UPI00102AFCF4|nr:hypothetical protein [Krasilnikovia cinnamomea]
MYEPMFILLMVSAAAGLSLYIRRRFGQLGTSPEGRGLRRAGHQGVSMETGAPRQQKTDEGLLRLRTSPPFRRAVWAYRLMLPTPFLMVLSAVVGVLLPGPAHVVLLVGTFGLLLVGLVLGWSAVLPFSRTLRETLPNHPRDIFGPVGVPTALIRDTFRRKPVPPTA